MAVVGLFMLGSLYVPTLSFPSCHIRSTEPKTHSHVFYSVCVAGIVRVPLLSELKLSDITWTSVSVGVWVNVECNIGILSACLPILRPLFSTKYNSSPVAYLTRIVRSFTNSHSSSSNGSSSSSDPEKGVTSEPDSDSTAVEASNWPNEIWKWSRNNSSDTSTNVKSTVAVAPTARPLEKQPERQRKYRTWYSAAAELLPEIDLSKQEKDGRQIIDVDEIPRYRDDHARRKISETGPVEEGNEHGRQEQENGQKHRRSSNNLQAATVESTKQSQQSSLRVPMKSGSNSQRSSWGIMRDVWNLMPSIVFWDKSSLIPSMNSIR